MLGFIEHGNMLERPVLKDTKTIRFRGWAEGRATLSSTRDMAGAGPCNTVFCMAVTLMKSQQLWLPAQDLPKRGPVSILPWMTERPHPFLGSCWKLMVTGGRGSHFLHC